MDYVLEETCIEWRETISALPLKLTATAIRFEWNALVEILPLKPKSSN
jgi:hypothetical protein